MSITYRVAHDVEDLKQVIALEIQVWGLHERDAFPIHMLRLAPLHGGAIIVAEQDNQIIGLNIGYPARRGAELVLWSYITGVHPSAQANNIGYELKQTQRQWAKENGYSALCWTFDPLQPKNANFNLNHLETVAYQYHPNLYGAMDDAINKLDLPSDRLEVRWDVIDKPLETPASEDIQFLLGPNGIYDHSALEAQTTLGICLPDNQDDKRHWQQQLRAAFEAAFQRGYRGVAFQRADSHPYYVLCADVSD